MVDMTLWKCYMIIVPGRLWVVRTRTGKSRSTLADYIMTNDDFIPSGHGVADRAKERTIMSTMMDSPKVHKSRRSFLAQLPEKQTKIQVKNLRLLPLVRRRLPPRPTQFQSVQRR